MTKYVGEGPLFAGNEGFFVAIYDGKCSRGWLQLSGYPTRLKPRPKYKNIGSVEFNSLADAKTAAKAMNMIAAVNERKAKK